MRSANYPDEIGVGVPPPSERAKRAWVAGRCVLCVDRAAPCWVCAMPKVDPLEEFKRWTEG